ncbi:hypothetical protein [Bradyrhizobium sp. Cp5.3]|uniref:hypothetical protein n=1 Tax=Bradyrhizobium sp. Cp5.3 TaxID=443598 RepID=UPI0012EC7C52|nr:hypothetical protein [Bradyrhizobium sp. Cp5.3]
MGFYDGCNYHSTEYVQTADGNLEELTGYHRVTTMACPHQSVGSKAVPGAGADPGAGAERKEQTERDSALEARQACDHSNALRMDHLKRIDLKGDNLLVTHSDDSIQKFEKFGLSK